MITDRCFGKVICAVLLFTFPLTMMGSGLNAAMLVGTGNFALNGVVAPSRTAVLDGDKITTQGNGAVAVTAQGSSVVISSNSDVVYRGNEIQVNAGTAQINTDHRMAVRVEKFTVTPAKASAQYRVSHTSGLVLVAALNGAVSISDGNVSRTVDEGNTATISEDPAPQRAPAAMGTSAHVSKGVAIAVSLATAGAAAAVAIATTGSPASPSVP